MSLAVGAIEAEMLAPPLRISEWLQTQDSESLSLETLQGRVVVLHAFQMLCPGCVAHGLPQAQRIADYFGSDDVTVLGLHSVFEHHVAMTPVALRAFVHEYRWSFPIGVDQHGDDGRLPLTMRAYGMRGTPTLIVIDQRGRVRYHWFGRPSDLEVGSAITRVLSMKTPSERLVQTPDEKATGCSEGVCIPVQK